MKIVMIGVVLGSLLLFGCGKKKSDSLYGTKVEMTAENCTKYAGGTLNAEGLCIKPMTEAECTSYGGSLNKEGSCVKKMSEADCSKMKGTLNSDGSCTSIKSTTE